MLLPPARPKPKGGRLSTEKRSALTDANPTDRGKPGTKRHMVTDACGAPVGRTLSEANRHDSRMLAATLDAILPLRSGRRGCPRRRPYKLHADKAHDHRRCRQECRERGITPRTARRGIGSSNRLGRYSQVVERTLAWLARFRCLTVRYERRAGIHLASPTVAAVLTCMKQIRRLCPEQDAARHTAITR